MQNLCYHFICQYIFFLSKGGHATDISVCLVCVCQSDRHWHTCKCWCGQFEKLFHPVLIVGQTHTGWLNYVTVQQVRHKTMTLTRLFPEACLVGARLVYFGRWSAPVPQNLGQLCRWALLSHLIAERSWYGHAAAAAGSKLWQLSFAPAFPSAI